MPHDPEVFMTPPSLSMYRSGPWLIETIFFFVMHQVSSQCDSPKVSVFSLPRYGYSNVQHST